MMGLWTAMTTSFPPELAPLNDIAEASSETIDVTIHAVDSRQKIFYPLPPLAFLREPHLTEVPADSIGRLRVTTPGYTGLPS